MDIDDFSMTTTPSTSRRILLLVTGMSPQIVTETVYGLAVKAANGQSWIPDEVHVISTTDGLTQLRATLFTKGHFAHLLADYALPAIRFDESCLHSICDANGTALADLKTPADNELAANTICEQVRLFTEGNTELHVSIAGGRKTMGFYAGYALSLYGRPQDRMSHVLVSSEFESSREFFYPTPGSRFITDRDGKSWDAKNAEVWLADIPFVRLRAFLAPHNLASTAKFSDVVSSINLAQQPLLLTIDPKQRSVSVAGISCKLPPRGFAFYYWFCLRAKHQEQPYKRPVDGEYRAMTDLWVLWKGADNLDPQDKKSGCLTTEHFEQALNEIKKKLAATFGHALLPKINISNDVEGDFLPLLPSQIDILK